MLSNFEARTHISPSTRSAELKGRERTVSELSEKESARKLHVFDGKYESGCKNGEKCQSDSERFSGIVERVTIQLGCVPWWPSEKFHFEGQRILGRPPCVP